MSSEKAPPFLYDYLKMKIEAENYIISSCGNLKPCMIRPGMIVDAEHRGWSPFVGALCDLAYNINRLAV